MIRISLDTDVGMNRNSSDSLGMNSYPILSEWFRNNPKNFLYLVWWKIVESQSDLIRFNLNQSLLGFTETGFSIRINPNHFDLRLIQIDALDWIGLSQIDFWQFLIKRGAKRFSDWFGIVLNIFQNCSKYLWFAQNEFQSDIFATAINRVQQYYLQ